MAKRRGHGEGTIGKRTDGRWCGRVSLGWADGRRQRKMVYGNTRAEAAGKLRRVIDDHERGLGQANDKITVGRFLRQWLDDVARQTLRPSVFRGYESLCRVHLIPKLGKYRLAKLAPATIQAYLNRLAAEGLSPYTVRNHRTVLRSALSQAERWGIVQRNAAALTNQPRVEYEEVQPLTAEEIDIFQSAIQGHRLEGLFATSLIVGWRLGEALGLTWNDVDLDGRTIRIRQALTRHDGAYHFAEPKTDRSRRTIPLPDLVVDHLRAHRTRQMEEQLFAGAQWEGESWKLVFATTSGTPLNQAVATHQFQAVLKKAGLRHQRFHDLRHCAASVMLSAGTPMRVVQEVLGHSDMSTTANLYSHVAPSLTRDALDRVGELLTPATNRSVS